MSRVTRSFGAALAVELKSQETATNATETRPSAVRKRPPKQKTSRSPSTTQQPKRARKSTVATQQKTTRGIQWPAFIYLFRIPVYNISLCT